MVFSTMNDKKSLITTHNAVKIGINPADGNPIFSAANSPMILNRIGMDGARFLNPFRPSDLYISSFEFNAAQIRLSTPIDAKVGVQVVQFTPEQLSMDVAVDTSQLRTLKYPAPSYYN